MELKETRSYGVFYGVLEEKNLEFDKDDKGNITGIKGDIVASDDTGSYVFRIYSKLENSKGETSKLYADYVKVKNEYVSRVEAAQTNSTPTEIRLTYSVRARNYPNKQGGVSTAVNYQAIFINQAKSSEIQEQSHLDITGSVINMKKQEGKEYSTVTIAVVNYNGAVCPVDLVVETESWDDVVTQCSKGDTVPFLTTLHKVHVESARPQRKLVFGKAPKIRSGYDIVSPRIIGIYDPYEEEDAEYLPPDEIERGLIERESIVNNKTEETESVSDASNPEVAQIMKELSDDDIPF